MDQAQGIQTSTISDYSKEPYNCEGLMASVHSSVDFSIPLSGGMHHSLPESDYESLNLSFDPLLMSFRDRHRLLDEAYDSLPDPEQVSAKYLDNVSRKLGLCMEEVLAWFEDEQLRRSKLLARFQTQSTSHELPQSPESLASSRHRSASSSIMVPTNATSNQNLHSDSDIQKTLSTAPFPMVVYQQRLQVPPRSKRGRPPRSETHESPSSAQAKRRKLSCHYPCIDCGRSFPAERWSEHVKRVHFPDYIWECPKPNGKTGKPCGARPFFRTDNFTTHLRGEHHCDDVEISSLKKSCKFAVVGFFHKSCGICGDALKSRDVSLEHIKDHLRDVSRRASPPEDLGLSEWKEQCGSEHRLQRGVHYQLEQDTVGRENESGGRDDSDRSDDNGSGGPNLHDFGDLSGSDFFQGGSNGQADNGTFYSDHQFDYNTYSAHANLTDSLPPYQAAGRNASRSSSHNSLDSCGSRKKGAQDEFKSRSRRSSSRDAAICSSPILIRPEPPTQALEALPQSSPSHTPHDTPPPSSYTYPTPRPSILSQRSGDSGFVFGSEEIKEKQRCIYPGCGKLYKDLKAHLLTHQNERPEKCPVSTCDYHIKGFARKYDKNRHALTHYRSSLVCGFCPDSGPSTEKSFNRADVFKRHLASTHGVEQTPPNSRKNTSGVLATSSSSTFSGPAPGATGKCSTCSKIFTNAQDFYEHLDDCILQIVCQKESSEALGKPVKAEDDTSKGKELLQDTNSITRYPAVLNPENDSLQKHIKVEKEDSCTNIPPYSATVDLIGEDEDEDEDDDFDGENDDNFTSRRRARQLKPRSSSWGLTHSKGGVSLNNKSRKKRNDYPASWECPTPQIKRKKRVLAIFDGSRRPWKDDMMLDNDWEVRIKLRDEKTFATDLNVQTVRRADTSHGASAAKKSPWNADGLERLDLEELVRIKPE